MGKKDKIWHQHFASKLQNYRIVKIKPNERFSEMYVVEFKEAKHKRRFDWREFRVIHTTEITWYNWFDGMVLTDYKNNHFYKTLEEAQRAVHNVVYGEEIERIIGVKSVEYNTFEVPPLTEGQIEKLFNIELDDPKLSAITLRYE